MSQDYPFPPIDNTSIGYVDQLANCTYNLIQYVCDSNGCPGYDPTTDISTQCIVASANAAYVDPCAVLLPPDWTLGLHVAAIFVVLVASTIGAAIPILAKYHPGFSLDPYVIMLGKCMDIGVVLACGLVHMLQPSSQSLTSPCVPWEFNTDYNSYAFLFAMLAILFMHFFDYIAEAYLTSLWIQQAAENQPKANRHEIAMVKIGEANTPIGEIRLPAVATGDKVEEKDPFDATKTPVDIPAVTPPMTPSMSGQPLQDRDSRQFSSSGDLNKPALPPIDKQISEVMATIQHTHGENNHVHSVLLAAGFKRTISAYMIEFAVTVHSVFIGLANGIDGDDQLHVLLVALVFHQMFEGIALGSRIADANLPSHWHEVLLTTVFSIAAPLGIAIGIAVKTGLNPNGETFLLIQGTFDGVCGGILIYIGLVLLLKDFPEDMNKFCGNDNWKKAGMFGALYLGAGLMAFIGVYDRKCCPW